MSEDKKSIRLGMSASKAHAKLGKDILYHFVEATGQNSCYRCGQQMTRETFSIEHKTAWLHSDDPLGLFFSQDNIAFSHLRCNIGAARRTNKLYDTPEALREAATARMREHRERVPRLYDPSQRKAKYQRNGT